MSTRSLLASALLAPALVLVPAAGAPALAASSCQGHAATIEGSSGTINGTEGDDVIVGTGPDVVVNALGGNDLVCVVGGHVSAGAGNDAVFSTAHSDAFTEVSLTGGEDSYTSAGGGESRVYVSEVSGVHVVLGWGGGDVWLGHTSVPGAGSVELGPNGGRLFALGESEAHVDLEHDRAGVDGLLDISIADVYDATASGAVVRMTGNAFKNDLAASGCNVVINGGEGRDILHKVGGGVDRSAPCPRRSFRSLLKGGAGPDRLTGRGTDDVLRGGSGRDVVDGKGGRDRCTAEVERHCER